MPGGRPENGAQLPEFARICRYRRPDGPWQNSPALGFRSVISLEKIYIYLSKNPVNLPNFTDIFWNYYLHFAPSTPRPGGLPIPASGTPSAA